MAPVIHTPVEGFAGIVVGVSFQDGVGETDDAAALEYFERAGYGIEAGDEPSAGTPLTADELALAAASGAAGDSGQTPPSTEHSAPEDHASSERPHPVRDNKGAWFEHLTRVKPDHGLDLEKSSRADLIAAVEEIEKAAPATS